MCSEAVFPPRRSVATSAPRVRAGSERRELPKLPAAREARESGRSSVLSSAWLMAPRKRAGFHRPKTHDRANATARAVEDVAQLQLQVANLQLRLDEDRAPVNFTGVFDMQQGETERTALIKYLWAAKYDDCVSEVIGSDLHLKDFLDCKTSSSYRPIDFDKAQRAKDKRLNFVATMLIRNRNVHMLPRQIAIFAVLAKQKHINHDFWEMLACLRVLPSRKWTNELIQVHCLCCATLC